MHHLRKIYCKCGLASWNNQRFRTSRGSEILITRDSCTQLKQKQAAEKSPSYWLIAPEKSPSIASSNHIWFIRPNWAQVVDQPLHSDWIWNLTEKLGGALAKLTRKQVNQHRYDHIVITTPSKHRRKKEVTSTESSSNREGEGRWATYNITWDFHFSPPALPICNLNPIPDQDTEITTKLMVAPVQTSNKTSWFKFHSIHYNHSPEKSRTRAAYMQLHSD